MFMSPAQEAGEGLGNESIAKLAIVFKFTFNMLSTPLQTKRQSKASSPIDNGIGFIGNLEWRPGWAEALQGPFPEVPLKYLTDREIQNL